MQPHLPFADVLEAVNNLQPEEQEALTEILRQRLAEQGHRRVAAEAREALQEFQEGRCRAASVDELMDEILS